MAGFMAALSALNELKLSDLPTLLPKSNLPTFAPFFRTRVDSSMDEILKELACVIFQQLEINVRFVSR